MLTTPAIEHRSVAAEGERDQCEKQVKQREAAEQRAVAKSANDDAEVARFHLKEAKKALASAHAAVEQARHDFAEGVGHVEDVKTNALNMADEMSSCITNSVTRLDALSGKITGWCKAASDQIIGLASIEPSKEVVREAESGMLRALGMLGKAAAIQDDEIEQAATDQLRSSGVLGLRRYDREQRLLVRRHGGTWAEAEVRDADPLGKHALILEDGLEEQLQLHPWNHAPRAYIGG